MTFLDPKKSVGTLALLLLTMTSAFSLACDREEDMHELEYASLAFGDGYEVEAGVGRVIRTHRSSSTSFSFQTSEYNVSLSLDVVLDCARVGDVVRSRSAHVSVEDGRYSGELQADVVLIRGGTVHLEYFGTLQRADDGAPLEVMGEIHARAEPFGT